MEKLEKTSPEYQPEPCAHNNTKKECPICHSTFNSLQKWFNALDPNEKEAASTTWGLEKDRVSLGDESAAKKVAEALKIPNEIKMSDLIAIAGNEALGQNIQSPVDYWSDPNIAGNYSEHASVDDGSLDQIKELLESRPELFNLSKNAALLELGSGTGLALGLILEGIEAEPKVFGSDISEAMYENNSEKKVYADFQIGDLSNGLPETYKDMKFEMVLAISVFHFLTPSAIENLFSEIHDNMEEESAFIFSIGSSKGFETTGTNDSWEPIEDSRDSTIGVVTKSLGVPMYYYDPNFIKNILQREGFSIALENAYFLSESGNSIEDKQPSLFIVARKVNPEE